MAIEPRASPLARAVEAPAFGFVGIAMAHHSTLILSDHFICLRTIDLALSLQSK